MSKSILSLFVLALWWGSMSAVGFWVVPMLFASLPSPALAGPVAGKLFSIQMYLALACGLVLLASRALWPAPSLTYSVSQSRLAGRKALLVLGSCMALALIQEFVLSPRILMRENLALWHGLGSAAYFLHWLLLTWLLYTAVARLR